MQIEISKIKASPFQPRLKFELEELKREIQKDGLLSALTVWKPNDYYELLDGEKRLRVLKQLGWKKASVDVREIKDRKSVRRKVYKLNKIRENYSTEEEAKYFKKLQDKEGMTAWEISKELNENFQWILANLNVFKFPEEIQKAIWRGKYITISHIRELETTIARDMQEALARASETIKEKLTRDELRRKVRKRQEQVDEKLRAKAIEETLPEIDPETIKIKTPEDYEKAAEALKREAKKKREAELTPEQKTEIEAKKQTEKEEKERKRKEKEEKENARIQEEAEKIAKIELIKDKKFREEVKGDLSRPEMEALGQVEADNSLTKQDKENIRQGVAEGRIRGEKQIKEEVEWIKIQKVDEAKKKKGKEKSRELESFLKRIQEVSIELRNKLNTLRRQFQIYPETLKYLPQPQASRTAGALNSLIFVMTELQKTLEGEKWQKSKQEKRLPKGH